MEFLFEQTPWDEAIESLQAGDKLSGIRALSLLEDMSEEEAEEALLTLEERGITLDISDLPKGSGDSEAALRLRLEQQLSAEGKLLEKLDENDPLRLYLEELAGIPAAGDVNLLAQQYVNGDDMVAQQLVNLSLGQVVESAYSMTGRGVLLLDLIQEGSLGLWQGVLNYANGDYTSYIQWWIDQYLAKAVLMQARSSGIGQKLGQGIEDYRDMDQKLLVELGRNPTIEEIADAIHVSAEEASIYADILTQARAKQQLEDAVAPKEQTPEDEQAVENTAYFQARQRILEMLSSLTQQEAKVLTLRFGLEGGLPQTPQQAGETLGLTADEVIKLEAEALLKLRKQAD